jgi:hypothetical protein
MNMPITQQPMTIAQAGTMAPPTVPVSLPAQTQKQVPEQTRPACQETARRCSACVALATRWLARSKRRRLFRRRRLLAEYK